MPLILVMGFFFVDAPALAVVGEEGVGLPGNVVNFRQAEAVGLIDELLVNAGSADDVDVLVGHAGCEERVP